MRFQGSGNRWKINPKSSGIWSQDGDSSWHRCSMDFHWFGEPSWNQVGPTWLQVEPSWRVKRKPGCTSSQDVAPMRSWSATWHNIVPTWLENPPKMEARRGVRALAFRSCLPIKSILALSGPKVRQRGPKRAPRVNFGKILDRFLGGFGWVWGAFWDVFGKVLGGFWIDFKMFLLRLISVKFKRINLRCAKIRWLTTK